MSALYHISCKLCCVLLLHLSVMFISIIHFHYMNARHGNISISWQVLDCIMFKHQHKFYSFPPPYIMRTGQIILTLKVIGRLVGIIHNWKALDKFFVIAPELSKLLHEFAAECVRQWQQRQNNTTPWHHNLSRIMKNAETDIICIPWSIRGSWRWRGYIQSCHNGS